MIWLIGAEKPNQAAAPTNRDEPPPPGDLKVQLLRTAGTGRRRVVVLGEGLIQLIQRGSWVLVAGSGIHDACFLLRVEFTQPDLSSFGRDADLRPPFLPTLVDSLESRG